MNTSSRSSFNKSFTTSNILSDMLSQTKEQTAISAAEHAANLKILDLAENLELQRIKADNITPSPTSSLQS